MATVARARSKTLYSRTAFGEFTARMDKAAENTAADMGKEGARLARINAPVRSGRLKRSIKWKMTGATSAEFYATAKHAMPIETGWSEHLISGKLVFFWTNAGKWFYWDKPYPNNDGSQATVVSPANPGHPFLMPAYRSVATKAGRIARKNYS